MPIKNATLPMLALCCDLFTIRSHLVLHQNHENQSHFNMFSSNFLKFHLSCDYKYVIKVKAVTLPLLSSTYFVISVVMCTCLERVRVVHQSYMNIKAIYKSEIYKA